MLKARNTTVAAIAITFAVCSGLMPSHAQTGSKLIISNFASDPEQIQTHVVVSDVDGVGPNIRISIFSDDGRLVYERYETLQAFGKLNYNPLTYLNAYQHGYNQNPKFQGTVRIESDGGNLIGQYWEMYTTPKNGYMNIAVPASAGEGYDKLVCQHFVSDKSIEATIVVANAEDMRPVTINVKMYSDDGGLVATEKFIIQPNGIVRINPYKVTKGLKMTGTAYIVVVGPGKITGEYWQSSQIEKYRLALPLEGVTKIR
ncbi:MAG: hypothetical protein QHI48_01350 [Bacteroidota bacterium]|nr:hypothetical protein [Bacteroidota bacterium]